MALTTRFYSHSGKSGMSYVVIPLIGGIAAFVLSMLYAYVTIYVPIAGYLSVLFIIGLVIGVGFCVAYAATLSHCRSPGACALTGLGVGLFTLYASWVWFEFVLLRREGLEIPWGELPTMFLDPGLVWNIASELSETGWYSIFGVTPSGAGIWILWLIEAAIIVGGITLLAAGTLADKVYCERCGQWAEDGKGKRLQCTEDEDLMNRAAAGDVEALAILPKARRLEYPQLAIATSSCPRCAQTDTYRIDLVQPDDEGKEQTVPVTERVLVSSEIHAQLLSDERRPSHFDRPAASEAPPGDGA